MYLKHFSFLLSVVDKFLNKINVKFSKSLDFKLKLSLDFPVAWNITLDHANSHKTNTLRPNISSRWWDNCQSWKSPGSCLSGVWITTTFTEQNLAEGRWSLLYYLPKTELSPSSCLSCSDQLGAVSTSPP